MWWRAVAAGASVVVAAVVGVVTTFATQHPSRGLWASLGVLVVLGAVLQALVTCPPTSSKASSPRP